MNRATIIENIYRDIKNSENKGNLANYIPELGKVDVAAFGVHYLETKGNSYGVGDCKQPFSIQSIVKVLSLTMAYRLLGGELWQRVGVESQGTAFNSLIQIEQSNGIPRNPFVNGGAIVICDILLSHLDSPKADFLAFIHLLSGDKTVNYDVAVVASEKSVGYRNKAIANLLKSFGNLTNEPDEVLDFYFHICSLSMSCETLAKTFLFLANDGIFPESQQQILSRSQTKRLNAVMQSCGFYDESGDFTFRVGLPGKSGVGGGIIALYPGEYTLAVWSPKLNDKGNSYRGIQFLESFTTQAGTSIF